MTTGDDGRFQAVFLGTVRLDPRAPRRQISLIPAVHFEALDGLRGLGETGLEPDGKATRQKRNEFPRLDNPWRVCLSASGLLVDYFWKRWTNFGSSFAFGWRRNERFSALLLFF